MILLIDDHMVQNYPFYHMEDHMKISAIEYVVLIDYHMSIWFNCSVIARVYGIINMWYNNPSVITIPTLDYHRSKAIDSHG